MKKKFLLSILTVISLTMLAIGLTACSHEHTWSEYVYDSTYHWQICKDCGEISDKDAHNFSIIDPDNGLAELCACGAHQSEFNQFKVTFALEDGISVLIYPTQTATVGYSAHFAYARDSVTGALLNNGDGQVNFEVLLPEGRSISSITVTPADNYKNLKDTVKDNNPYTYRLTKITGDLTVTIESEVNVLDLPMYDLPVIAINTWQGAPIIDKENYVACSVSLLNTTDEFCFTSKSAGIRYRGNSTNTYPKKPYRIKFDSKQSLFGWTANKSWVLLAMYQDFSNIKDYAAFKLATDISTENSAFVPHAKHVEVYLNGVYQGLYLLTDQVDENAGRTAVKTDIDESMIEVPFFVEWDENAVSEGIEDVDWFRIVNEDSGVTSYYNIKYPEVDERYNQAQFNYIKNYILTVNSLCHDANVTQEQFEEYIDLASFIDYYLLQEVMDQVEINWKSINMTKAIDGKLMMGPLWDYDWAVGGPMMLGGTSTNDGWYSSTNWFAYMLKVDWFKEAVKTRWAEIESTLKQSINDLKEYKASITEAALRNAALWDFDTNDSLLDFTEYYDWVLDYIDYRITIIANLLSLPAPTSLREAG